MTDKKPTKTHDVVPAWWHPNGAKMRPLSDLQHRSLQVVSNSATLTISPDEESRDRDQWLITWEIRRRSLYGITARIKTSTESLRRAFGLKEGTAESGRKFLRPYGADSAEEGRYIRAGNYLNIPHPGTGRDGDPNISILLDEDIQELLRQLLDLP